MPFEQEHVEAGHVFIVRGDLTKLSCDAWLMPCGHDAVPDAHWYEGLDLPRDFLWPERPSDWGGSARRCMELHAPRRDERGARLPTPWLVHVGGGRRSAVSWFVDGVREFMSRVAERLKQRDEPALNDRERPLVALPMVGTGRGGARRRSGQIVRALLPLLYGSASRYGFDVALVAFEATDYAAAQRERRDFQGEVRSRWPTLNPELRAKAKRLAARASGGELVLFLGAGVSQGAGLPTWGRLLEELAADPALKRALKWQDLRHWGYADQARIIEHALGGGKLALGEAVARRLRCRHYALTHAMLATLPTEQVVTTNYDQLFEVASAALNRPTVTLPYETVHAEQRWVLKMHGCISHPEDIVLTREDYLRYAERRRALAGIVQSLLLTRHMLFVGFSLDDENFHRIADDVRKIAPQHQAEPFASSVVLADRPFLAELWLNEIEMIPMLSGFSFDDLHLVRHGARQLEIFFDYMLSEVADPNYLLDPRFEQLLTAQEAELRAHLMAFLKDATPSMRQTGAWKKIEQLYRSLGWDDL